MQIAHKNYTFTISTPYVKYIYIGVTMTTELFVTIKSIIRGVTLLTELFVTIKSEESSFKQKFLLYDDFKWHSQDPTVKKCVEEALSNAKIEPTDITVRALLVMR